MAALKGRYSKAMAGRKLACFAAAFSALLLVLCLNMRDVGAGLWRVAAVAFVVGILLFSVAGARHAMATVLLAAALAAAVFYVGAYRSYLQALDISGYKGDFTVEVQSFPSFGEYYTVFDGILGDEYAEQKVTVIVYGGDISLSPGDVVRLKGRATIQEQEYFLSAAAEGRFLTIRASANDATYESPDKVAVKYLPLYFGESLRNITSNYFQGDEQGLLTSLLTGSKEGMSQGFKNILSLSGTSHITAVSGMHVAIIASAIVLLLGRRYGMICALPIMLFFGLSTGMNPPVIRALLMSLIALGAFVFNRESDGITTVMAALLLILTFQPLAILSVSLQLSFASVLGILLLTKPIKRTLMAYLPIRFLDLKGITYALSGMSVSMAASFGSMPILALYFQRISIVSPVTNLAVLWIVPVIMGMGILLLALSQIWVQAAAAIAVVLGLFLKLFILLTTFFARLGISSVSSENYIGLAVISLVAIFLIFGYCLQPRFRKYAIIAVVLAVSAVSAVSLYNQFMYGDIIVYSSGLTMIKNGRRITALVPTDKADRYMQSDYLRCIYNWGRTSADVTVFGGTGEDKDIEAGFPSKSAMYFTPMDASLADNIVSPMSIAMFESGEGHGCLLETKNSEIIWMCGATRGSAVPWAEDEKRKAQLLVLDGRLAGDYYQLRRLDERVSADTTVVCGIDDDDVYLFNKTIGGKVIFIKENESFSFHLQMR